MKAKKTSNHNNQLRTVRVSRELADKIEQIGAELANQMGFRNTISIREVADMLLVKGMEVWKRDQQKAL